MPTPRPLIVVACLALLPAPTSAQEGKGALTGGADGMIDALTRCHAVAADVDRLACYDRAAATLLDARARREVVVVDRAEQQREQRRRFGLAPAAPPRRAKGVPPPADVAPSQIEGVVANASIGADGFVVVTLADGSRWHAVEGGAAGPPRRGTAVVVRKGAFGSYFMRFGGISLRARRVS